VLAGSHDVLAKLTRSVHRGSPMFKHITADLDVVV
jgi:hypothetical protein